MSRSVESYLFGNLEEVLMLYPRFSYRAETNQKQGITEYQNGTTQVFKGFPKEAAKSRLIIVAEFDVNTVNEINQRITDPLAQIADNYGIGLASEEQLSFSPHITIQKYHYRTDQINDLTYVQNTIARLTPSMQEVSQDLVGEKIVLDRLVLAGSNLYVCLADPSRDSSSFSSFLEIQKRRDAVAAVFRRSMTDPSLSHSGRIKTGEDIIHATIGRIVKTANPQQMVAFANETYSSIGTSLVMTPIHARIGRIYAGSSFSYTRATK